MIITIEENIIFKEFIVNATMVNDLKLKSKQSEVLKYKDYKIKSLRLYFDRLELSQSIFKNPLTYYIINKIISNVIFHHLCTTFS